MVRRTIDALLFDPATNETVRTAVPAPLLPGLEFATHLGDPATVLAVATGYFWLSAPTDRDRGARVLAVALLAFAITNGLKGLVLFERPVEQLAFAADGYGGYSFPSGHSLGAAAVYGAIATASDWATPRRRYTVSGAGIALVALSRLVLGVHYLGDVVVGACLGLALGVGLLRVPNVDPGRLFALAGVLAIASYGLPARAFMPATVGAALGAAATWRMLEDRPFGTCNAVLALGVVLPVLLGVRLLSRGWGLHWSVELGSYALALSLALAASVRRETLLR